MTYCPNIILSILLYINTVKTMPEQTFTVNEKGNPVTFTSQMSDDEARTKLTELLDERHIGGYMASFGKKLLKVEKLSYKQLAWIHKLAIDYNRPAKAKSPVKTNSPVKDNSPVKVNADTRRESLETKILTMMLKNGKPSYGPDEAQVIELLCKARKGPLDPEEAEIVIKLGKKYNALDANDGRDYLSFNQCQSLQRTRVNPLTGRKLLTRGQLYKRLLDVCIAEHGKSVIVYR